MISAILDAIRMVLGLVLDVITLPFRAIFALLGGAEFEFQRFSAPRHEADCYRNPTPPTARSAELQAIAVTAHDRLKADWRQPEGLLPSLRDGGGRSL